MPLRNAAELEDLVRLQADPESPEYHRFLTVAQFRARYAPSAATVQQAISVLRASGLQVLKTQSQLLQVGAPAANVERAFAVTLGTVRDAKGVLRVAADRPLTVPKGLAALKATVFGLAYHAASPHPNVHRLGPVGQNRYSDVGTYWFDDLKQAYQYPSYAPFNGAGVTIATVGESDFSDSDAALYFGSELLGKGGLAPAPVLQHLILGGAPFDPTTGISDEADVDVQQSGGSAPGATILGIDVPAIGEGFLYGYSVIDDFNLADIVSTSYGECELYFLPAYNGGIDFSPTLRAYHELFLQGNAEGITFLFSSGDDSGTPCGPPGYVLPPYNGTVYPTIPGTSIWSSDPNATSVGGTNLVTSFTAGKLTSTYVRESAYHDTLLTPVDLDGTGNLLTNVKWGSGGGPSVIFQKPWYQNLVNTGSNMRTDPDISMQMGGCPRYLDAQGNRLPQQCGPDDSSAVGVVGGEAFKFIGTSLSTPEFAGLLAVLEQAQGNVRFGNVNGLIYRLAHTNSYLGFPVFHQGIPGENGVVSVARGQLGYNQIVGVGTPIANNFSLLPYAPLAGDPQTPSNP